MSALKMTLSENEGLETPLFIFALQKYIKKQLSSLQKSVFDSRGLLMRYRRHADALLNVCDRLCLSQSVDINSPSQFAKIHLPIC